MKKNLVTERADLVSKELLLSMYTMMTKIRLFDVRVREMFLEGKVKGTAHSCVGQEAIAAGACAALDLNDFIVTHHRGHGHCIAKGADIKRMMAELMGKVTGYCRGLGGSMHIADLELNILGANGVVGAGIGIGTGAAVAAKLAKQGQAGIAFFGDGASNEGIFHEACNLAAVWKLPIVYLCENNQYALTTSIRDTTPIDRIAKRSAAYGMPGITIDGNDVGLVFQTVRAAIERAKAGLGPTLIEAMTYRWDDHSMRANLPQYRSFSEEQSWQQQDPLPRAAAQLVNNFRIKTKALEQIKVQAQQALKDAEAFARDSAEPTLEDLNDATYAPHRSHVEPKQLGSRALSYVDALKEAIAQSMQSDEKVFVLGEDVGKTGGIFGVTRGLLETFGEERVRDTPISEQVIGLGAVGAAICGYRPIAEIQIFDFVTLLMDSIVNQAAKFRFMLGGRARVPVVFRGPQGGGLRLGAQHSQSLESWFMHIPGLVVLAPSSPYEAKGLLMAAIQDDNPVVFLEHKLLYLGKKEFVPIEPYAIPIGKAVIKRHGTDITVVATFVMVERALQAASLLDREGISVEVIDPRTLRPLDMDTIIASVKRTSRLVIAHEGWRHAAEVSASVAEQAIDWLDAPIGRVTSKDVPMPYNDRLEQQVIPSATEIAVAIRSLVRRDSH